MWPYWFLFALVAWRATVRPKLLIASSASWSDWWRLIFVVLVLMIGLRHEVGGDWLNYIDYINEASYDSFQQSIAKNDPAYSSLNWIAGRLELGPYFVNTVCAVLFVFGLLIFCRTQPLPWLALVVAVPYLVTVVAMGYTRQGVAIGLAMMALVALGDRKTLRFVFFIGLAAMFHKSAVILMPLAILGNTRNRLWTMLWVGLASMLFYVLMLQDAVDALKINYLDAEYESSGALIRVTMNAVPALLFLWFRKKFILTAEARRFWTWMSLIALVFVLLLAVSPSSTAVDRVALYWIPLQLFVLSRLPDAMARRRNLNVYWIGLVVLYSALVLWVWLTFAVHASSWLPYRFYPLEWFLN